MLQLQIWSRTEAGKRTYYLMCANLLPLFAVKLGDFGLAKFHTQQDADAAAVAAAAAASGAPALSTATTATATAAAGVGLGPGAAAGVGADAMPPVVSGPAQPPGSERTGVCGTSYYISPEIANGWASYDEKV